MISSLIFRNFQLVPWDYSHKGFFRNPQCKWHSNVPIVDRSSEMNSIVCTKKQVKQYWELLLKSNNL